MKNLLLSLGACIGLTTYAQALPDSVTMGVAGNQVTLAEFMYIA